MAEKIQRQTQKIFGGQASTDDLAVFGSFKTGNPIYTDNIEDLQSNAYEQGWSAALAANEAPFMEEMNGVQYGFSKQLAYQFQEGIPEYDAGTEYFIGSMVKALDTENNIVIYKSIKDNNIGQELSNTDYWIEWVSGANADLSNLTQAGIDNIKQYATGGGTSLPGTSLPLFTPVLQDHILSFEESKGYALQASYVYKQSTPERYGYPDFYNRCLEEYKNSSTEILKISPIPQPVFTSNTINGITISDSRGNTNILQAIMNGTNNSNQIGQWATYWININYNKPTLLQSYQIQADGHRFPEAPSDWTLQGSNNGVNFYVLDTQNGVRFNLGELKTFDIRTQNETYKQYRIVFTAGAENGSNGELKKITFNAIKTFLIKKNTNGHLFYDIADRAYIDEVLQNRGVAWFYGIDEENERIFLPRNNRDIQLTCATSNVNQHKEAGLPNITGRHKVDSAAPEGCFYGGGSVSGSIGHAGETDQWMYFDASRSSSVYGNSNRVQDASVRYLLYIVVGNTEEEKALTEVTEVTTSDNDTVPLFTGQYFDFKPNNVSWLKAGEQANNGGIYVSCYNELVNELTNPKYGLKVIEESEMIAGIDYSEYWIINQDGMYFRTPTKLPFSMVNDVSIVPVGGNGKALGLTNGSQNMSIAGYNGSNQCYVAIDGYGKDIGQNITTPTKLATGFKATDVTSDLTNSGLIADLSSAKATTAQLYFKVANAVQNLELWDAGEVLEALADKQDKCIHITETYANSTSGYRIWSDGYCEQWGRVNDPGSTLQIPITLLKPYKNTDYNIVIGTNVSGTGSGLSNSQYWQVTQSGFTMFCDYTGTNRNSGGSWSTKGYIN